MKTYRVLVFSVIEMKSPFRLGSGESRSPFADLPVLRSLAEIPYIPGATLAGAFAGRLTSDQKKSWLGQPEAKHEALPSPLVVDDAFPVPGQRKALIWPVELRPQVTLLRDSLTALGKHHFTTEMLPVGVRFPFFCRCDLHEKDLVAFTNAIGSFLMRGGSLGGKANAGNGVWKADKVCIKQLNMTKQPDRTLWMSFFHGFEWNGVWDDIASVVDQPLNLQSDLPEVGDWSLTLHISFPRPGLHLSAGMSGMPKKDHPDLSQAQRQRIGLDGKLTSEYVDYGTAVKGRLRTAMEMLLRTWLRARDKENWDRESLQKVVPFKPTKKSSSDELNAFFGHTGKKGQWKVSESSWTGTPNPSPQDHIRIDEFTQHVIDGAKFVFEPISGGMCSCTVAVSDKAACQWQKALLFNAAALLELEILPWGGHGSRGYLGATVRIENKAGLKADLLTAFADLDSFIMRLAKDQHGPTSESNIEAGMVEE